MSMVLGNHPLKSIVARAHRCKTNVNSCILIDSLQPGQSKRSSSVIVAHDSQLQVQITLNQAAVKSFIFKERPTMTLVEALIAVDMGEAAVEAVAEIVMKGQAITRTAMATLTTHQAIRKVVVAGAMNVAEAEITITGALQTIIVITTKTLVVLLASIAAAEKTQDRVTAVVTTTMVQATTVAVEAALADITTTMGVSTDAAVTIIVATTEVETEQAAADQDTTHALTRTITTENF